MGAPDSSKPHIRKVVEFFSAFHVFLYRLLDNQPDNLICRRSYGRN